MVDLFNNGLGGDQTSAEIPNCDPLELPGRRVELAKEIKADIDAWCVEEYSDGHRTHLGASVIGRECSRQLWFMFRWVLAEVFDGRKLRLFQRGHLEEARFIQYLRGIGATVLEADPDTGEQFRISAVMGHFGGSLDGQIVLPEKYGVAFGMLSEYKTKGTGPMFNKLSKDGVQLVSPEHFAQMCSYGEKYGHKYALYMAVNKNDDDIYVEIVRLDWTLAVELENKAHDIITAQTPPVRIAQSPAYLTCKFCHFSDVCFNGAPIEVNCRSCAKASAVEGKKWHCSMHDGIIPKNFIKQGCADHSPIV